MRDVVRTAVLVVVAAVLSTFALGGEVQNGGSSAPAEVAPPSRTDSSNSCDHHMVPYKTRNDAPLTEDGSTQLSLTIAKDGTVKDATVIGSSGNGSLDWAAKTCALLWKYKPREKDGVPVETVWQTRVAWRHGPPPR